MQLMVPTKQLRLRLSELSMSTGTECGNKKCTTYSISLMYMIMNENLVGVLDLVYKYQNINSLVYYFDKVLSWLRKF